MCKKIIAITIVCSWIISSFNSHIHAYLKRVGNDAQDRITIGGLIPPRYKIGNAIVGWSWYQNNPVYSGQPTGAVPYGHNPTYGLQVFKLGPNNYIGYLGENMISGDGKDRVRIATSVNGIDGWTNLTSIIGPGVGWESIHTCEQSTFIKDGTYYVSYTAWGDDNHGRIGIAYSNNPMGPYTKYPGNPLFDVGPQSWDSCRAATPSLIYDYDDGLWKIWYGATPNVECDGWKNGGMGLATASSPTGPWTKYPYGNDPVFNVPVTGVSGKNVMKVKNPSTGEAKYYMAHQADIQYAVSSDGVKWLEQDKIGHGNANEPWRVNGGFAPKFSFVDDRYMLSWGGSGGVWGDFKIGLAFLQYGCRVTYEDQSTYRNWDTDGRAIDPGTSWLPNAETGTVPVFIEIFDNDGVTIESFMIPDCAVGDKFEYVPVEVTPDHLSVCLSDTRVAAGQAEDYSLQMRSLWKGGTFNPCELFCYTTESVSGKTYCIDTQGQSFTSDYVFNGLDINVVSWSDNEGGFTFSLYPWNTDYKTSVNGTAIASQVLVNCEDNSWQSLNFSNRQPGKYVWEIKDRTGITKVGLSGSKGSRYYGGQSYRNGVSCPGTDFKSRIQCYAPASKLLPEPITINNLWISSGRSYETEVIVTGEDYYIDRAYMIDLIPNELQGLTWLKTAIDDRTSTANPFLSFDVDFGVNVYVGIDTRKSIPGWMGTWTYAGAKISDAEGVEFVLYKKYFPAGTVSLGGDENAGTSNMYIVLLEKEGSSQVLSVNNIVAQSGLSYVSADLDEGDIYYIDRSFTINRIPSEYEGLKWIRTANNDKSGVGSSFLTFDVDRDVSVFVGIDSRIAIPSWLTGANGWNCTEGIIWDDSGHFNLYRKDFSAGGVSIGGNEDGSGSMYIVLVKERRSTPYNMDSVMTVRAIIKDSNDQTILDSEGTVGFQISGGSASLLPNRTATCNARVINGEAIAYIEPGFSMGANTITASYSGLSSVVSFMEVVASSATYITCSAEPAVI